MTRLFFLILSITGVTGAGIGVVIALSLGLDTLQPILVSAAAGTMAGAVASWLISRRLLAA